MAPGSLSRRLAALGQGFEVQVLRQGLPACKRPSARPWAHAARAWCARCCCTWAASRWSGPARPCCSARHAGPLEGAQGLGSRPLAHLLYGDPRIQRSALCPLRLPRVGATRRGLARSWQQAGLGLPSWACSGRAARSSRAVAQPAGDGGLRAGPGGPAARRARIPGKPLPSFWVQTLGLGVFPLN